MVLGELLSRLENETAAGEALAALGDAALFEQVSEAGVRFGEAPAEYVACAASRFAAGAAHEEWMSLIAAAERADDPGRAALSRILNWALARDREDETGCGGSGGCTCAHGG